MLAKVHLYPELWSPELLPEGCRLVDRSRHSASWRRPLSARRPRAANVSAPKVRGTALHHLHGSR